MRGKLSCLQLLKQKKKKVKRKKQLKISRTLPSSVNVMPYTSLHSKENNDDNDDDADKVNV